MILLDLPRNYSTLDWFTYSVVSLAVVGLVVGVVTALIIANSYKSQTQLLIKEVQSLRSEIQKLQQNETSTK